MTRTLRIGYIPLFDAGLLFVAAACGFDEAEGLKFELFREASWANLRDKLALGIYDAAHMLAPAVLASALGLEGFDGPISVPMLAAAALGLDGNAISVSPALAEAIAQQLAAFDGDRADPAATSRAMAQIVATRAAQYYAPMRFAHVFPYSAHHYQLRLWLQAGGGNPDAVRLMVTPPPLMQASLSGGYIDGFCVGEPWNTLAQQAEAAEILHPCRALVKNCPEKVLAFPRETGLREPETLQAAARAVRTAAAWGEAPENKQEFAEIIAGELGGDVTPAMLSQVLSPAENGPWLRLDAAAAALAPAQALWLYVQMALAGQTEASEAGAAAAMAAFLPQQAENVRLPELTGAPAFDPEHWREFLAALTSR